MYIIHIINYYYFLLKLIKVLINYIKKNYYFLKFAIFMYKKHIISPIEQQRESSFDDWKLQPRQGN